MFLYLFDIFLLISIQSLFYFFICFITCFDPFLCWLVLTSDHACLIYASSYSIGLWIEAMMIWTFFISNISLSDHLIIYDTLDWWQVYFKVSWRSLFETGDTYSHYLSSWWSLSISFSFLFGFDLCYIILAERFCIICLTCMTHKLLLTDLKYVWLLLKAYLWLLNITLDYLSHTIN